MPQSLANQTQAAMWEIHGRDRMPLVSNRAEARELIFGGSRSKPGRRFGDGRLAEDAGRVRVELEERSIASRFRRWLGKG